MTHITKNLRIGWRQFRHSLIFQFIELAENKVVQNKRITMAPSILLYKPNISKLAHFISDFDWKDTNWSPEMTKTLKGWFFYVCHEIHTKNDDSLPQAINYPSFSGGGGGSSISSISCPTRATPTMSKTYKEMIYN